MFGCGRQFGGAAAGQADVADAARPGRLGAEVAFEHRAAALLFVRGVGEHLLEALAQELLPQPVGLGGDVEVGARQPLLVHEEQRRAVRRDVADHAQHPQPLEQLADPLDGVAAPGRQLALVDGAELGEDAVVEAQQRADEVVELVALHAQAVEVVAAHAEYHPRGVLLCVGQRHVTVLLEELQGAGDRPGVEVLAGAEVVDVELEGGAVALADADAQVVADLLVDLLHALERRKLLLEAADRALAVVGRDEQQGVGACTVAPGASGLLVVAFERIAHRVVDDEAHVGLVDAHAEGVGRDHHPHAARDPLLLSLRPLGMAQPAVVGRGRDALLPQQIGDLLRRLARAHVDDARARDVVHEAQQLAVLVVRMADAVREVGPREAAAQDVRFGEFQVVHDVLGDPRGGRGREGQHRDAGQALAQLGDAQVRGAEVVAPLRDAVGLVDGDERDVHAHDAQTEGLRGEPLGGDVEELHVAVDAVVQRDVDLPRREPRVDGHGRDAPCAQAVHLVLHQGDERRNDDGQSVAGHRWHLVGERLAAAGGHQRQRVAPLHDGENDLPLHGAELPEAPPAGEGGVYLLLGGFHNAKVAILPRICLPPPGLFRSGYVPGGRTGAPLPVRVHSQVHSRAHFRAHFRAHLRVHFRLRPRSLPAQEPGAAAGSEKIRLFPKFCVHLRHIGRDR